MKLVDILARELDRWPEGMSETVGQVHKGYLHGYAGNGHPNCQLTRQIFTMCDDYETEKVTRAQWQAAADALRAAENAVPEWNGEGLPPVGVDVQMSHGVAQVMAYSPDKKWVFLWVAESNLPSLIRIDTPSMFRPIRTPAQIAEEEQKDQVNRLVSEIERSYAKTVYTNGEIDLIEWVIALGYRKFEIVDN